MKPIVKVMRLLPFALLACPYAHAQGNMHGCPTFPSNNIYNLRIDSKPLVSNNAAMMSYLVSVSQPSGLQLGAEPINYVDGNAVPLVNMYWNFDGNGTMKA